MDNRQLNLNRVALDENWIDEKIQAGHLDALWKENLTIIKQCLEDCFPGLWDIHVEVRNFYSTQSGVNWINIPYTITTVVERINFFPVVRFPEFIISNGYAKHTIRDLFVRLTLDKDTFTVTEIKGTRGTITYKEYLNKYSQSHLPNGNYISGNYKEDSDYAEDFDFNEVTDVFLWENFCLGQGEIVDILFDFSTETAASKLFNCDLLQLLLLQVEAMVKWESKDGGPYNSIDNIYSFRPLPDIDYSRTISFGDSIIHFRKQNSVPINFTFVNDEVSIVDDNLFDNYLKIHSSPSQYILNQICIKNEQGNSFAFDSSFVVTSSQLARRVNNTIPAERRELLIFQGAPFPFHIIEPPVTTTEDKPFYIHPKIHQYVKSKLESDLKTKVIKNSAFEAYY